MSSSALNVAVAQTLAPLLPQGAGLSVDDVAGILSVPPDSKLGDLAFGCFRLAKALRMAPPKIAAELAAKLADAPPSIIQSAGAAGPYVNLRLDMKIAGAVVLPSLAQDPGADMPKRAQKVMVEFSQPNTHKGFHVGHMRNLSMGDAIVRLLRADGYDVVAANYLGDVGAHIAKCLWWYLDHLDEQSRVPPEHGRGEWLGEMYAKASGKLDTWHDSAKAGDELAAARVNKARARTTDILQKLEAREPEMMKVWKQTRAWSLEDFDEIYAWTGVKFDRVFFESEVDRPGLALVEDFLKRGIFVESEGAIGIFNEEVKHMPFFMLRKKDGTSLYSTKDLALARLKFEEHAIDRSIYVVDTRQSDHFRHVFLTLHKMGFAQAEHCQHVPYEMVELPSGAMAARKGNVVLFRALRERMLAHLETRYLGRYRGQWPDQEVDQTARVLALGAIKYGMLNRDVNQKIIFDLEAWLNLEGNTGPYIQYAAARLASILRKAAALDKALASATTSPAGCGKVAGLLVQPEERELMLTLDALRPSVAAAAAGLRPSLLCTYLHTLAKAVNRFCNTKACKVIDQQGDLLQARLLLVTAANEGLRWGLDQLGISAPERM